MIFTHLKGFLTRPVKAETIESAPKNYLKISLINSVHNVNKITLLADQSRAGGESTPVFTGLDEKKAFN